MTPRLIRVSLIALVLAGADCSENGRTVVNPPGTALRIIAPVTLLPGDPIPVIARQVSLPDESTDWSAWGELVVMSDGGDPIGDPILMKKGIGAVTAPSIDADSIRLGIDGAESGHSIRFDGALPLAQRSGTLPVEDSRWEAGIHHLINGDLTVPAGSTLRIEAGAIVRVASKANIHVNGSLVIAGRPDSLVTILAANPDSAWGGFILRDAEGVIDHCIFGNGGADESQQFGHSYSQPIIMLRSSSLEIRDCYLLDCPGKGFGATGSEFRGERLLVTRCDTGGEFESTLTRIVDSHVLDIPNADGIFDDDDNDGLYFMNPAVGSEEPSLVDRCCVITGKDDAIDHKEARLVIRNSWLEGFTHEGVAGSRGEWLHVINTVVRGCENGIEAGYGTPTVLVDHCVLVDNDVGLKFGDGYDWGCDGSLVVTNTIAVDNLDNVHNHDILTGGPVPGGIEITWSLVNDAEYDAGSHCLSGTPYFDSSFRLAPGSIGVGAASDGGNMGLIP